MSKVKINDYSVKKQPPTLKCVYGNRPGVLFCGLCPNYCLNNKESKDGSNN